MSDLYEEFEEGDVTIKIYPDHDPYNPRENDCLGHMVCHHPRYRLGDEQLDPKTVADSLDELEQYFYNQRYADVLLPLWIYDHGNVTITARPTVAGSYPDHQWDVSMVGFIYITAEQIRKEYGAKKISVQLREKVREHLMQEVEAYDQYLRGDVWGFVLEIDGKEVDSCWGCYGLEYTQELARRTAREEHSKGE